MQVGLMLLVSTWFNFLIFTFFWGLIPIWTLLLIIGMTKTEKNCIVPENQVLVV